MDAIFPAGNPFGIPDLDIECQPDSVPLPVWGWGTRPRTREHLGTWHFFVDDYRFSRILTHPDLVVSTGCVAAVEPNISVYDDTPLALALASIYRRRYVARYWQSCGVSVFVDVNLPARVLDCPAWSYGIPSGWSAYATRGYDRAVSHLDCEYAVARRTCDRPVLLVVGGGKLTAAWCQAHPGAVHSGYQATTRSYSVQG